MKQFPRAAAQVERFFEVSLLYPLIVSFYKSRFLPMKTHIIVVVDSGSKWEMVVKSAP